MQKKEPHEAALIVKGSVKAEGKEAALDPENWINKRYLDLANER
jgi:hypothetical protein